MTGPDDSARDLADRRGMETTVYRPAEDSRLLAEAAVEDLRGRGVDRAVDVGTGSGYVAARLVEATDAAVVATDCNPHACREARERVPAADVVRADLCSPFRADAFDAVCFNPPYLPTDPDAAWDDWMERALSGGASGRAVIEPFLEDLPRVLAPGGAAYLLVSSLTGYDEVLSFAAARGLAGDAVARESFPFESLSVVRLTEDA
jgi:release factor glutamine methyltransferase